MNPTQNAAFEIYRARTIKRAAKSVLDADGRHIEKGGNRQFAAILRWEDRRTASRWSAEVIDLAHRHHPDAFEDGGIA